MTAAAFSGALRTPRGIRCALGVVISVAAALRLVALGEKSFWIDETFSVWMARQPLDAMFDHLTATDMHPPLYYTLLHFWMPLGDGETPVRLLSVVFGVATVPVVFALGRVVRDAALGLVAAGLVAVAPIAIAYAQEARMYTMLTFFAAASILCMAVLTASEPAGHRFRPGVVWLGLVASTTLALLSHNTALLLPLSVTPVIAVAGVRALRVRGRRAIAVHPFHGAAGVATGLACAFLLWLPWLPYFVAQSARVDGEFWLPPPTPAAVLQHWHDLALGAGDRHVLVGAVVALGLAAAGLWRLRSHPAASWGLPALLVVPPGLELLISVRRPIFYTQTLVWTVVPLCVLIASGLLLLRPRPLVLLAGAVVAATTGTVLSAYYRAEPQENWAAASAAVARAVRPGDLILFDAGWAQIPFDHYFSRDSPVSVPEHGVPVDMFQRGTLEPKTRIGDVVRLDRLVAGHRHVWLVYSHEWYTDPGRIAADHLTGRFGPADTLVFTGVTVHRYSVRR